MLASAGLHGMLHCAVRVSCSLGITGHMSTLPGRARPWELFLAGSVETCSQWRLVHIIFCRTLLVVQKRRRKGRTIHLNSKDQLVPIACALLRRVRLQQATQDVHVTTEDMSLHRMQAELAVSANCASPSTNATAAGS